MRSNKQLVKKYYEIALNGCEGIEKIVTTNFKDHHFPEEMQIGPEGVKQFFNNGLSGSFSDMKIQYHDLMADNDNNKVSCFFTLHATHTGEFAGIQPKGNKITCKAVSIFRIEDGKLAEAWEVADLQGLFAQLQA